MSPFLKILHNFIVPVVLGFVLTVLKIMSDQKELNFDEANGIALDLILVSIGAFSIFLKGKEIDAILAAGVGDAFLAMLLLYMRYRRARKRARLLLQGQVLQETRWWSATLQLLLGIASFLWTITAV